MTRRRWLARGAFALILAAAAVMIGFAGLASLAMVGVGAVGACLVLAGGYWFLARRGVVRWLAFGVVILVPVAVLVVFALNHVIWVGVASLVLVALAVAAAQAGADPGGRRCGDARARGPAAPARFPDHEPEVGGREGGEVRA